MRSFLSIILVLEVLAMICVGGSRHAAAGLMYGFADATGAPETSFQVGVGGTVDVRVYLKETAGTSFLTEDLFSASVRVTFDSPSGIAAVLSTGNIFPNSGFTDLTPPLSISSTEAGFTGSVGLDPFLPVELGDRILLGTFRFTGLSVGTVQLDVLDRDALSDDTLTGFGTVLDGLIATSSAQLEVTSGPATVPEPTSLAIFCSLFFIMGARRVQRRRRPLQFRK